MFILLKSYDNFTNDSKLYYMQMFKINDLLKNFISSLSFPKQHDSLNTSYLTNKSFHET